ncbi:MAG: EAL domain-containing protein [Asticcacaulis sp.]
MDSVKTAPTKLDELIRFDQLVAVRHSVQISIPINIILSLIVTAVTAYYSSLEAGLLWFVAASTANLVRTCICRAPLPGALPDSQSKSLLAPFSRMSVDRHFQLATIAAFVSGCVWALMPALCAGYTTPQANFYLVVICGITAGAVTHGNAYAYIPISFLIPPLMSMAASLSFVSGSFDRYFLTAATLLYIFALVRSSLQSQAMFREGSRGKNKATALAASLRTAHISATEVAEEMRHRAIHDTLTGLLNRSGFVNAVDVKTNSRSKSAPKPLCLMILDLDGFKSVNDVFGHRAGDEVLIEVARRLERSLSKDFTIARLGGDEFAIMFETDTSRNIPTLIADRIVTEISAPFTGFDAGRVGISIGIFESRNSEDFSEMMVRADAALYAAKSGGRNRYYAFDDELDNRLSMKRDIERDLLRALNEGELSMWYQPIMCEGGCRLSNFEALLRWQHPRYGWVPPADIVETAAVLGLSEPLLKFIIREVCQMISRLEAVQPGNVWVAMNVSPREMSRLPVDTYILDALSALNISPQRLELEVTEETAMDIRTVQDKLKTLSNAGIRIAIDDFGVGYSSLSSLRQLSVDRIKIDNSFIRNLPASKADQVMVQAIINLGHSLGIDVVGEGVETEEIQTLLQNLGCETMQGYHLGRPMPEADLNLWMKEHHKPTALNNKSVA